MNCPKCQKWVDDAFHECPFCGIIFAKFKKPTPQPDPINIDEDEYQNTRLTTCPDCGKEISKRAQLCPNCGAPLEPKKADILAKYAGMPSINPPDPKYPFVEGPPKIKIFGPLSALIIAIAILSSFFSSEPEPKKETYESTWNEDVNIEIQRALVAYNVTGCGCFKYKRCIQDPNKAIVYCSPDGENWTRYDIDSGFVSGPKQPDPRLK